MNTDFSLCVVVVPVRSQQYRKKLKQQALSDPLVQENTTQDENIHALGEKGKSMVDLLKVKRQEEEEGSSAVMGSLSSPAHLELEMPPISDPTPDLPPPKEKFLTSVSRRTTDEHHRVSDEFMKSPSRRVHDMLAATGQLHNATELPFVSEGDTPRVMFLIPCGAHPLLGVEDLFRRLAKLGVGVDGGEGWASMMPLSLLRGIGRKNALNGDETSPSNDTPRSTMGGKVQGTIKSRILVNKLFDLVSASARISFDYVCLAFVAATIACIGLATDNQVIIVASMLVSPIMGPILEITLGTVVHDWKMVRHGLLAEVLGVSICILVGFLGALCELPLAEKDGRNWPVPEMTARGDLQGFYTGIAIAIPSGFGVALSVLGDNTACLVGVAISASLLPPATNCGMLLGYATLNHAFPLEAGSKRTHYESHALIEMSAWSLLLTTGNIICIWIAGVIMFKIKEVSPIPDKSEFWDVHVGNVRKYNDALNKEKGEELAKRFRDAMRLMGHEKQPHVTLNTLSATNSRRRKPFNTILNPNMFVDPNEEVPGGKKQSSISPPDIQRSKTMSTPSTVVEELGGLSPEDNIVTRFRALSATAEKNTGANSF